MNRSRARIVALAVGIAAIAGVFALVNTLSLGGQAHATTGKQVAARTAQLNRYEASLRRLLAQKPPSLPPVPVASGATTAAMQSAAPVRIVYHRPPPIVITKHRSHSEGSDDGSVSDD